MFSPKLKKLIVVLLSVIAVQLKGQTTSITKEQVNAALEDVIPTFTENSNWQVIPHVDMKEIMEDSLWAALNVFEHRLKDILENKTVNEEALESLDRYCYENFNDSIYSSVHFLPVQMHKDSAIKKTIRQFQDILGESNCKVKFVSWDGWDGETAWTMARFDIHHHAYIDQVLIILNTRGKINSLFSTNSEGTDPD